MLDVDVSREICTAAATAGAFALRTFATLAFPQVDGWTPRRNPRIDGCLVPTTTASQANGRWCTAAANEFPKKRQAHVEFSCDLLRREE